jgi:hypothetical protein
LGKNIMFRFTRQNLKNQTHIPMFHVTKRKQKSFYIILTVLQCYLQIFYADRSYKLCDMLTVSPFLTFWGWILQSPWCCRSTSNIYWVLFRPLFIGLFTYCDCVYFGLDSYSLTFRNLTKVFFLLVSGIFIKRGYLFLSQFWNALCWFI